MSDNLAQLVTLAVTHRQTKLFIGPEEVYPALWTASLAVAGPRLTVINVDEVNSESACEQFRKAGRAGNVILIKAVRQVGPIEAMVYVWHQSGGQYGTGRGELLKANGTTDCSDYTRDGCVVVLFVTPHAYARMDKSTLQRVYPPKDAYYFPSEKERSWDIFKR